MSARCREFSRAAVVLTALLGLLACAAAGIAACELDAGDSAASEADPAAAAAIAGQLTFPSRIAQGGPDELIAVSDASHGTVLVYDRDLNHRGTITGLDVPLGVAIDDDGNIFVGSDGPNRIEAFTPNGDSVFAIGDEELESVSDIAFDGEGKLYVADSLAGVVRVYSRRGVRLRDIGAGGDWETCLEHPVTLLVHERDDGAGELLYVADREQALIKVFDLEGRVVDVYGGASAHPQAGRPAMFAKPQGLAVDSAGRLHVLDCRLGLVQVLDLPSGSCVAHYGRLGTRPGELELPLDIHIDTAGRVIVANAGNARLETYPALGHGER